MGELIKIDFLNGNTKTWKQRSDRIIAENASGGDYSARCTRVRESMNKINKLMKELREGSQTMKYELITYGVCGNNSEGYEVNDAHSTGVIIELPADATDKQIIQALKEQGEINKNCRFSSFSIEGEEAYSLYIKYNTQKESCYPVCELRNMEGVK